MIESRSVTMNIDIIPDKLKKVKIVLDKIMGVCYIGLMNGLSINLFMTAGGVFCLLVTRSALLAVCFLVKE